MTTIEWTRSDDGSDGKTWNPIRGCDEVSPGCANCYAKGVAARFSGPKQPYEGLARFSPKRRIPQWTGEVTFVPKKLAEPLRWRKPQRVFVNSMSDLFHEKLTNEEIAAVFGVMAAAPQHTFQVLTKRAERMRAWFEWIAASPVSIGGPTVNAARGVRWHAWHYMDELMVHDPAQPWIWPLPNVHLGVSVEDQKRAEERIPHLLATPARVRFLSCEPLLGPVDLTDLVRRYGTAEDHFDALACDVDPGDDDEWNGATIDWVIVGGESGPGARPFDLAWARTIVEQCHAANVPVFVKQLGADPIDGLAGCSVQLRDRKGGDASEWPEELRVREFPRTTP